MPLSGKASEGVFAQTHEGQWLSVESFDSKSLQSRPLSLSNPSTLKELLENRKKGGPQQTLLYSKLKVPLPFNQPFASLGLGLSYPSHQQEVGTRNIVYFQKRAPHTSLINPIHAQPYLDFEAEISILMHRHEPELFGYLIHNDLTDRGIQVRTYDNKNPAPGFSKSKSLNGLNAHGLFMAVGSLEMWKTLEVKLYRNNIPVQHVKARENVLDPKQIHAHVFANPELSENKDWVLIGTGTPAGTIFRAPSLLERIWIFTLSGFNFDRAQKRWLEKFDFLKDEDVLEFRSQTLGYFSTKVISEIHP
jgi:2-keto-4-pentenoate hydratase/2-oxohepta-3-ene-1,7-dioic acid hydratase in catechol pathway